MKSRIQNPETRNQNATVAKPLFILASVFCLLTSALQAQNLVKFLQPTNAPVTTLTLTKPALQIYPLFYPPENYTFNLQPGSNAFILNPGAWTATFGVSFTAQFNVATNYVWPAANSTNNWLDDITNTGPAAFATFGLTTNIAVTNLLTGTSNQLFFTNGVLTAIH